MYIVDHVYEVLSKIDISDDFSIRRQKEKAFAYYQALRIQYHRPDRIHDVIDRKKQDLSELGEIKSETSDFIEFVLEVLHTASKTVGDDLFQSMSIAFLDYIITDLFWKLVCSQGFVWVHTHFQQAQKLVANQLIEVDPSLKRMTIEAFIQGYDASLTTFEKNAFMGYGDEEEEEYSNEELDAILAKLAASRPLSDRNDINLEENDSQEELDEVEWTLERQNEEVEERFSHYYHNIINAMNGYEASGLFPYYHVPSSISISHTLFDEDLSKEQVISIVDRLKKEDYPGHQVKVELSMMDEFNYVIDASWKRLSEMSKN